MKSLAILSAFVLVGSCATTKYSTKIQNIKDDFKLADSVIVSNYANTITSVELSTYLYEFSSDEYQGRAAGEEGQKKAANYIKSYYQKEGINSPIGDSIYFQTIPKQYFPENINASENVLAYIEGNKFPEEVLVVSAHYDHLGVKNGEIYNGADDNGSGTSALMEMAQAFNLAKQNGYGPKRSILFLHLTAEEIGLQGSQYYTDYPVIELKNTIANLNIDMIGRIDEQHKNNPDYIYLIGSDRLSKELHYVSERINDAYFNMELDYTYNDEHDKNRFYYRSDHYNFAKHGIPVIFYFNGVHTDYHESTDTPEKINYELLEKRTKLIFSTAWQLANQENRLSRDGQL